LRGAATHRFGHARRRLAVLVAGAEGLIFGGGRQRHVQVSGIAIGHAATRPDAGEIASARIDEQALAGIDAGAAVVGAGRRRIGDVALIVAVAARIELAGTLRRRRSGGGLGERDGHDDSRGDAAQGE